MAPGARARRYIFDARRRDLARGWAAVDIARKAPNVKKVETYFVSRRPSWESDVAVKEQIRTVLIADPVLVSGRVDIAVYAGHVVLVGVVASRVNVEKFISDARA